MGRRDRIYDLAIDHARGRGRRAFVAAAGALIVLFNLIAAGVLGAAARTGGAPIVAGAVICAGDGMIVVGRDGKPADHGGAAHRALCPYCLPLMQGAARAPDLIAAAPSPIFRRVAAHRPSIASRPVRDRYAGAALPRAPPTA